MVLEKIYRSQKCQIVRPLSRIEEDGRNWLRRPKLCIKSCRATRRRRNQFLSALTTFILENGRNAVNECVPNAVELL